MIVITLSNLFTTPLHTGVPFSWKDLTPLARMALDQFVMWVNAESPYKTAKEYLAAVGIMLGTIIGVLPGLGGANGVAILLPVTFTMPPTLGNHPSDLDLLGRPVRRRDHLDPI